ncbi:MAG: hypothetical protein U0T74_09545 [Chitinophagales bacterium]
MNKIVLPFVFFLQTFWALAQTDNKNISDLLNPKLLTPSQEVKSLSTEEISRIKVAGNGYTVFNNTTGCLNYFFNDSWFEICGNCIPQFSKPKITKITPLEFGNEIELADSFKYTAILLPDSEIVTVVGRKIVIKSPDRFETNKKYYLRIYNLNEPCENKPVIDTFVFFKPVVSADVSHGSSRTVSTGSQLWLSEPSVAFVKDEKVCIKLNSNVYYNWQSLNTDPFNKSKSAPYYSKKICPSGYRIPGVNDAEKLLEYNKQEAVFEKFDLGKSGFVVNALNKKEEPTDDRFIFMLKDSDHPDAFQALLITNSDIRIARLPRDVYVRILCVSE